MEIGQPKRTIIVAPLEEPIPRRIAEPTPERIETPQPIREPVLVPA